MLCDAGFGTFLDQPQARSYAPVDGLGFATSGSTTSVAAFRSCRFYALVDGLGFATYVTFTVAAVVVISFYALADGLGFATMALQVALRMFKSFLCPR